MPAKGPGNPFYVLLVLAGLVFFVTACAYGMMALREFRAPAGETAMPSELLTFLNERGALLLGIEIAVLASATFAAMAYDQRLSRREQRRKAEHATQPGERVAQPGERGASAPRSAEFSERQGASPRSTE